MSVALLPPASLEMVDVYLDAAAVSALHVWRAHDGKMTMLEATPKPARKPPRGVEHVSTVWLRGSLAVQLKAKTVDALHEITRKGHWFVFPADRADEIIARIAQQIDVATVSDRLARNRVAEKVLEVEATFTARRTSGDLRGVARDFSTDRKRKPEFARFPTWGAYMRDLRIKAVQEAARQHGAEAIMRKAR